MKRIFIPISAIFTILISNQIYGVEFYEVDSPYSNALKTEYIHSIDVIDDDYNRDIDLEKIRNRYNLKQREIYAEEKKEEKIKAIEKDQESKRDKRKKFEEINNDSATKKIDDDKTKIDKKETNNKNWFDEWLINTKVKPMEIVGAYISFKLWLTYPNQTKISANETVSILDNSTKTNLFADKIQFSVFPAVSIAVGNDKFKWFRWEAELGYIPIYSLSDSVEATNETSQYVFDTTKKDFSIHLLTFGFNGFLQHDFFNKKIVGYVGLGLAVGYAFPFGETVGGDFVMPIVKSYLGISFMAGAKSKINITYSLMYTEINLPLKFSFNRHYKTTGITNNDRAIQRGSLRFKKMVINIISFEYMFYTA